jgi:fibronectin-binding autotransporter adhesin
VTAEQGDITLELFGTMGTISVSDNIQATGIGNVTLTTPQSLANDIVLGAAGAGGDIFVGTHVGTTTVTSFDLVMLGGGGVGLDTVLGSTASGPVVVNVLNNVSINGGTAGTATAAISTVSGPITVAAMNDVNLTGGTSAGATANIISTSGTVSVTGANINLTGGGNVTATPSIQSANDVTVLATTNIVLDGTATQAIPLIANSGGYSLSVTAGGSLTMSNSSRLSVASNYGALRVIASNITLNDTNTTIVHNGDGFLSINAVNNITINTAATMVHNGDGTMDVIAGFSTFLNGGSINQNGLGDLFVVVDNAAGCTAGGGGLTTAGGTNISTAGGALRIFTAQAANNPIAGNIQGAGFAAAGCPPGPDEQCGSCFLLNSADAGFPFTVFYKVGSYPTPPPAPPCSGCDCSGSGGCP